MLSSSAISVATMAKTSIYELNTSAEFCSHVAHHLALSPGPTEQCSLHLAQCAVCQPVPFARWLSSGTKLVTLIIWQKLQSNGCVTPQLVINVPGPCCSGSVDVLHTGTGEALISWMTIHLHYAILHFITRSILWDTTRNTPCKIYDIVIYIVHKIS